MNRKAKNDLNLIVNSGGLLIETLGCLVTIYMVCVTPLFSPWLYLRKLSKVSVHAVSGGWGYLARLNSDAFN